ncbi:MAG: substrate-binding domain-containing protein [Planctomycetota bacterium]
MSKARVNQLADRSAKQRVLLALGWYSQDLHHGVAAYAREAGWSLNIEMGRIARLPEHWEGEGVICVLGMDHTVDERVRSWKLPTVSIGPIASDGIPRVLPDNDEVGRLAYEHFFTRGFRHFAYFLRSGGPGEQLRYEGFRKHVEAGGFELHRIEGKTATEANQNSQGPLDENLMAEQLRALPQPLAVLAEYDDRAIEMIECCDFAGLMVPEQVAVLGVDNDQLRCEFAPVPLSSIDDDQQTQGYEAARLLDRLIQGESVEPQNLVEPKTVATRVSTDILAIEHPKVAAALRLIWKHFREPLTASDVADAVPMSGRRLHDAFAKHVGRTISQEIKRRRIEHAQRLLTKTPPMKLEAVASESGFTSGDRMTKVFVATTGETPSAYRKRLRAD